MKCAPIKDNDGFGKSINGCVRFLARGLTAGRGNAHSQVISKMMLGVVVGRGAKA